MSKQRLIRNKRTNEIVLPNATWCQSFWCQLRGLQFRSSLADGEGLLFVQDGESRINSAIHMFFVFMEIAVVWLDSSGTVVDKKLAKPWRPLYVPQAAAQYFIEAHPSLLQRVQIGDVLEFTEVAD
ncbi:MAG: DUF192 domain-containing protein [Anaerolineae bacterium]|nr:DUF192 domain-containing protein [Anaerolineae bacterium]